MSHQYYKLKWLQWINFSGVLSDQTKKKEKERTVKFYMSLLNNE